MAGKVQRFELSDGKSDKFWEIQFEGKSHTVRYGRKGTEGQTKTKEFESVEAARKSHQKLIDQKVSKGYEKVGNQKKKTTKKKAVKKKAVKKKAVKKKASRRSKSHLPPDLLEKFEKDLRNYELTEFRSLLLSVARPKLVVDYGKNAIKRMPKGMSRIGGAPDVASIDDWKEDGKYKVFFFQINMAEVPSPTDFGLPESGLLSVYSYSQTGDVYFDLVFNDQAKKTERFPLPKLKEYCDGDLDNKYNIPACAKPPRKLTITRGIYLPYQFSPEAIYDAGGEVEEAYRDLVDEYDDGAIDMCTSVDIHTSIPKGWVCLFRLKPSDYFEFGDCGHEYVWVKKGRQGLNFDKVQNEYDDF